MTHRKIHQERQKRDPCNSRELHKTHGVCAALDRVGRTFRAEKSRGRRQDHVKKCAKIARTYCKISARKKGRFAHFSQRGKTSCKGEIKVAACRNKDEPQEIHFFFEIIDMAMYYDSGFKISWEDWGWESNGFQNFHERVKIETRSKFCEKFKWECNGFKISTKWRLYYIMSL